MTKPNGGVVDSLALTHESIQGSIDNQERIFPYFGGEEVNDTCQRTAATSSTSADVRGRGAAVAGPDGYRRGKVKPRASARKPRGVPTDTGGSMARDGSSCTAQLKNLIVSWYVRKRASITAFAFVPATSRFQRPSSFVFPYGAHGPISAILSSREFMKSGLCSFRVDTSKDDPVYTPSDCFENVPVSTHRRRRMP